MDAMEYISNISPVCLIASTKCIMNSSRIDSSRLQNWEFNTKLNKHHCSAERVRPSFRITCSYPAP